MAADYAGALVAIKQRFIDNWLTDGLPTTPIGYVNGSDPTIIDPTTGQSRPTAWNGPWVLFEIVNNGSKIEATGTPNNTAVVYYGLIKVHLFVSSGQGTDDSYPMALSIGEIFRNKTFYNDVTAGCFVRSGYRPTEPPRIDQGDVTSDAGAWFVTTATIPFEYWHRA
jgi:hypothetical protein